MIFYQDASVSISVDKNGNYSANVWEHGGGGDGGGGSGD